MRHFPFILLSAAVLALGCTQAPMPQQPNIVILLADDLGYSDLALYADVGLATPNLERMARGGRRRVLRGL